MPGRSGPGGVPVPSSWPLPSARSSSRAGPSKSPSSTRIASSPPSKPPREGPTSAPSPSPRGDPMPGIHGLVCDSRPCDLAETSAAMANRLKHHAWYTDERHVEPAVGLALGRVSLGFVDSPAQPAHNEDETLIAVMFGEVYGAREARRSLESAGHRFRGDSHAELLLHGYEERGPSFFRELHGCFSAAIWDRLRSRLTLVNDRFGM